MVSGDQVRAQTESRAPYGKQTGAAAPLKHREADTGFIGNHVKPPIRPPSSGLDMSAELCRIYSAVQSEDRSSATDELTQQVEQAECQGRPPVIDALAALSALLRPKQATGPCTNDSSNTLEVSEAADQRTRLVTDFPRYPQVEIHALTDRPEWTGQPIGKTVKVGQASAEWQTAEGKWVGAMKTGRGQQGKTPFLLQQ